MRQRRTIDPPQRDVNGTEAVRLKVMDYQAEAGVREFKEETGLDVALGSVAAVHSNFHNPKLLTVGIWFNATVTGGTLHPVDGEFDALAYHDPAHPPELAFPTDALVLAELSRPPKL